MSKKYLLSLAEIVAVAYLTSLVGLLAADGFDWFSLAAWKAAALAAAPAGLTAFYGIFARLLGNVQSALAVDTREQPAALVATPSDSD